MTGRPVRDQLLGELAIRAGFVTRSQLEECLEYQQTRQDSGKKVPRIGEILAHKGYLTRNQVKILLSGKVNRQRGYFGEIAVRLGFATREEVKAALGVQKGMDQPRALGQVLRSSGVMAPHQIVAVLRAQGRTIARCRHCRKKFTIQDFEPGRVRCKRCGALLVEHRPAPTGATAEAEPAREGEDVISRPRLRSRLSKGTRVHGYRILGMLGEDMTGSLYRAMEESRDRMVTFKVLDSDLLSDPRALKSFLAAAQKTAGLSHPSIKRLYAVGKLEDWYFIAMEYIEGDSLRQVLARAKKLPAPTVMKIATQIVNALIHASESALIHRDIRPSNVLIDSVGKVKLSGFGVPVDLGGNLRLFAKNKRESACYLAPEIVVADADVDSRADIFSLGSMMYHLASGRPPLRGRSPVDVLMRLCEKGIPPLRQHTPSVPEELERIIARMVELEPADRYQSLTELKSELDRLS